MAGKTIGAWATLLTVAAAGYGFGSGWIRLGPPDRDGAPRPPGRRPRRRSTPRWSALGRRRSSRARPRGPPWNRPRARATSRRPLPQPRPSPRHRLPVRPAPVPAATTTPLASGTPAGGAATKTAVTPTPATGPPASLDRAGFQILPQDLFLAFQDVAGTKLPDEGDIVRTDGPTVTLQVFVDRLGEGVNVPASAAPATLDLTVELAKAVDPPFSLPTTKFTFPLSFSLTHDPNAPAGEPDRATWTAPDALKSQAPSHPQRVGPIVFTVNESGTYVLKVTKTCLGISITTTRTLTFQAIRSFPPKLVDIKQTVDGKPKTTPADGVDQVELGNSKTFTADVVSESGRNILLVASTGQPLGPAKAVDAATSTAAVTVTPAAPLVDQPFDLFAVDQWSRDRSRTVTVVIPSSAVTPPPTAPAKKSDFVEYTEFGRRRRNPDGFNPADKVETRVVRLYYYRDALKVAKIINRDVEVRNRELVDTRRRLADEARRKADDLTDNRRLQDEKAIRAAQAARHRRAEAQAGAGGAGPGRLLTRAGPGPSAGPGAGGDGQCAGQDAPGAGRRPDAAARRRAGRPGEARRDARRPRRSDPVAGAAAVHRYDPGPDRPERRRTDEARGPEAGGPSTPSGRGRDPRRGARCGGRAGAPAVAPTAPRRRPTRRPPSPLSTPPMPTSRRSGRPRPSSLTSRSASSSRRNAPASSSSATRSPPPTPTPTSTPPASRTPTTPSARSPSPSSATA